MAQMRFPEFYGLIPKKTYKGKSQYWRGHYGNREPKEQIDVCLNCPYPECTCNGDLKKCEAIQNG